MENPFLSMSMPDLGVDFDTPAPKVRLHAIKGQEALSRPFVVQFTMRSTSADIKTKDVLLKQAKFRINRGTFGPRYLVGLFRSFARSAVSDGTEWTYTGEVVPRLWFLSQRVNSRVFHTMTALDIIQKILGEHQITPDVAAKPKAKRAFTVQYNESDLDFIQRLMEEDGYFYFFQHAKDASKLHIADENKPFFELPNPDIELDAGGSTGGISAWDTIKSSTFGSVQMGGYNALTAEAVVGEVVKTRFAEAPFNANRETYLFPSRSRETDITDKRATLRQEAAEAAANLVEGACRHYHFAAGGRFKVKTIAGYAQTRVVGEYVISGVEYFACDDVSNTGGGGQTYSNRFTAFPMKVAWRELPLTPRPNMAGVHVAVVVGKSGEEISVNADGRIKVRFFWDRKEDATGDNTLDVRVMQPWSGNGWGWQHIPRNGTEVMVAFVNGDPDDPIVVGCLYNGKQKHPFALPDNKTKSGIKTRSSEKGGTADYNEFSFDDKKGSELVLLHAQKDHKVTVENNQTIYVMNDQKITVDNNRTVEITKGNDKLTVDKGDRTVEITTGNDSLKVGKGNLTTEVSMGDMSTTVKMGNMSTEVSMGNISMKAALGSIEVEAMQSIEFKVGSSSIKIDQFGVTIKGMMVKVDGQLQTEVHGLYTKISADALLQESGGIIMIG